MQARYYTLNEAKAALPIVKALMDQVQEARTEIIRLRPDIWPVLQKAAHNAATLQPELSTPNSTSWSQG